MPRPGRLDLPGFPVHVIQRGNNRAGCFFSELDRRFYLKCLAEAALHRHCEIHAYVLMSNHVHLLLTPREAGATARLLQDIGRRFVRTINGLHGRTGTLWEGRFKSSVVDSTRYFLNCHRYIELNPVRAGLAKEPGVYPWSSYAYYAHGKYDPLVAAHPTYVALGNTPAERQRRYREFVLAPVDETEIEQIRSAANACAALGSVGFLDSLAGLVGRPVHVRPQGRPSKASTASNEPGEDPENLF